MCVCFLKCVCTLVEIGSLLNIVTVTVRNELQLVRVCVEAQVCSCFAPGGTEGPEKRQAGMQPVRPVQDAFCLGSKVLSSLNTYACYLCEFYINTTIQTDINQLHKFLRK